MLKKLVIVGLGVTVLSAVAAKTDMCSYISTAYRRTADSVKENVPMEFQLDRARNMVRDLEPEIRRSMHVIAREEVELAELEERIDVAEAKTARDKDEILRLQADLETGRGTFQYAGHTYSAGEVEDDLSRRFTRFKTVDATLGSLRQMRDARARQLAAAQDQLTAMINAQRELRVEVENLEAKHKLVQVAQTSSDFQFDDSRLARCKELMREIDSQLEVDAKLAAADTSFPAEIPLSVPEGGDVVDQVAEYFGLDAAHDAEIATASWEH